MAEREGERPSGVTLSALSIGSLTLSPTFDPQRMSYAASVEQPANVSEEYRITAGAESGQTVTYALDSGTSAHLHASISSTGGLRIGDGSLSEGDNGTVIVNITVSDGSTATTYQITLSVTITADEIVDVETAD